MAWNVSSLQSLLCCGMMTYKIQEGPGPGTGRQRKRKDQTHGAWIGYEGKGGRRQKGDKERPLPSEIAM